MALVTLRVWSRPVRFPGGGLTDDFGTSRRFHQYRLIVRWDRVQRNLGMMNLHCQLLNLCAIDQWSQRISAQPIQA